MDSIKNLEGAQGAYANPLQGLPVTAGHLGVPLTAASHLGVPLTAAGHLGVPLTATGLLGVPLTAAGLLRVPLTAASHLGVPLTTASNSGLLLAAASHLELLLNITTSPLISNNNGATKLHASIRGSDLIKPDIMDRFVSLFNNWSEELSEGTEKSLQMKADGKVTLKPQEIKIKHPHHWQDCHLELPLTAASHPGLPLNITTSPIISNNNSATTLDAGIHGSDLIKPDIMDQFVSLTTSNSALRTFSSLKKYSC